MFQRFLTFVRSRARLLPASQPDGDPWHSRPGRVTVAAVPQATAASGLPRHPRPAFQAPRTGEAIWQRV